MSINTNNSSISQAVSTADVIVVVIFICWCLFSCCFTAFFTFFFLVLNKNFNLQYQFYRNLYPLSLWRTLFNVRYFLCFTASLQYCFWEFTSDLCHLFVFIARVFYRVKQTGLFRLIWAFFLFYIMFTGEERFWRQDDYFYYIWLLGSYVAFTYWRDPIVPQMDVGLSPHYDFGYNSPVLRTDYPTLIRIALNLFTGLILLYFAPTYTISISIIQRFFRDYLNNMDFYYRFVGPVLEEFMKYSCPSTIFPLMLAEFLHYNSFSRIGVGLFHLFLYRLNSLYLAIPLHICHNVFCTDLFQLTIRPLIGELVENGVAINMYYTVFQNIFSSVSLRALVGNLTAFYRLSFPNFDWEDIDVEFYLATIKRFFALQFDCLVVATIGEPRFDTTAVGDLFDFLGQQISDLNISFTKLCESITMSPQRWAYTKKFWKELMNISFLPLFAMLGVRTLPPVFNRLVETIHMSHLSVPTVISEVWRLFSLFVRGGASILTGDDSYLISNLTGFDALSVEIDVLLSSPGWVSKERYDMNEYMGRVNKLLRNAQLYYSSAPEKSTERAFIRSYMVKLEKELLRIGVKGIVTEPRVCPVGLEFYGSVGIGKTTVVEHIIKTIMNFLKLPFSNSSIGYLTDEKFESNMGPENFAAVYDDYLKHVAEIVIAQGSDSFAGRLIKYINNIMCFLNRSESDEKGVFVFRGPLFISTTNTPLHRWHGLPHITTEPQSLLRRQHSIHVQLRPQFSVNKRLSNVDGTNDYWDFTIYTYNIETGVMDCIKMCRMSGLIQFIIFRLKENQKDFERIKSLPIKELCATCYSSDKPCGCEVPIILGDAHENHLDHKLTADKFSITKALTGSLLTSRLSVKAREQNLIIESIALLLLGYYLDTIYQGLWRRMADYYFNKLVERYVVTLYFRLHTTLGRANQLQVAMASRLSLHRYRLESYVKDMRVYKFFMSEGFMKMAIFFKVTVTSLAVGGSVFAIYKYFKADDKFEPTAEGADGLMRSVMELNPPDVRRVRKTYPDDFKLHLPKASITTKTEVLLELVSKSVRWFSVRLTDDVDDSGQQCTGFFFSANHFLIPKHIVSEKFCYTIKNCSKLETHLPGFGEETDVRVGEGACLYLVPDVDAAIVYQPRRSPYNVSMPKFFLKVAPPLGFTCKVIIVLPQNYTTVKGQSVGLVPPLRANLTVTSNPGVFIADRWQRPMDASHFYRIDVEVSKGHSGSPVLGFIDGTAVILGIVVATSVGNGVSLVAPLLCTDLKSIGPAGEPYVATFYDEWEQEKPKGQVLGPLLARSDYVQTGKFIGPDWNPIPWQPFGTLDPGLSLSKNTKMEPTPFLEDVREHFQCGKWAPAQPSYVGPNECVSYRTDPWRERIVKSGQLSHEYNMMVGMRVLESFYHDLDQIEVKEHVHPLDIVTALNGDPKSAHTGRVNLKASAGPYYETLQKDQVIFDIPGDPHIIPGALLLERVERILECAANNKLPMFVIKDTVKIDEVRDEAKILAGGTRTLNVFNMHASLALRMYILPIIEFVYSNFNTFGIAVGMNPHGSDWRKILLWLCDVHQALVKDGDFKWYDLTQNECISIITMAMTIAVGVKLGYTDREVDILRILLFAEMYGIHLTKNDAALIYAILCTGTITTTLKNCFTVIAAYKYVLIRVVPVPVERLWNKEFRLVVFGDDHLKAGTASLREILTYSLILAGMKEQGLLYTSATKSADNVWVTPFDSSISFLKRAFRVIKVRADYASEGKGRVMLLAPLDYKSVFKSLSWYCPSVAFDDAKDQWALILENAQKESWLHGYEDFDSMTIFLDALCEKHGCYYKRHTYGDLFAAYQGGTFTSWNS